MEESKFCRPDNCHALASQAQAAGINIGDLLALVVKYGPVAMELLQTILALFNKNQPQQ